MFLCPRDYFLGKNSHYVTLKLRLIKSVARHAMFILETFPAYTERETGDAFPPIVFVKHYPHGTGFFLSVSNGLVVLKRVVREVLMLETHGHVRVGERMMCYLSS